MNTETQLLERLLNTGLTQQNISQELEHYTDSSERRLRHIGARVSASLCKSTQLYLMTIGFSGVKGPEKEECCCIRRVKAIGLFSLCESSETGLYTSALTQLVRLYADHSEYIRFMVATAIKQHYQLDPKDPKRLGLNEGFLDRCYERLLYDPNQLVRNTLVQDLRKEKKPVYSL